MSEILGALLVITASAVLPLRAAPETLEASAREIIAPLLDPAKIATLKGDRPVNARLSRVLGRLETARRAGGDVSTVIDTAQVAAGYGGTKGAAADKLAITWSRQKLEEFGCFTPAGLAELKKGASPTITKGQHAGDGIAPDHVLPRSVVPELAARFYNLEPLPARENRVKSAGVTAREVALARRWNRDGLLSAAGLAAVDRAAR
jgi:hypothetical protein